LQIPDLTTQTIELFNQKIDPIDAINYLAIQVTWDLESEITRLWAIADGVAGVPNQGRVSDLRQSRRLAKGGTAQSG
jgi:hypothetical protein